MIERKFERTFVIAEAGVNHNGCLNLAKKLVDAAAQAGADAVKFQAFKPDQLASPDVKKAEYQLQRTERSESQLEMLRRLQLDEEAHLVVMDYAKTRGIEFLSSPFDIQSLDMLLSMRISRIKIPSGEITNGPLLWRIGRARCPIIISTGMSDIHDIQMALDLLSYAALNEGFPSSRHSFKDYRTCSTASKWLRESLTLLHCTSEYPTPYCDVNLRAMQHLEQHFGVSVGLSDHSRGISVPIAAVAIGASVLEKHITLGKNMEGPDHAASLEPYEFSEMVRRIREVEESLGVARKEPTVSEIATRKVVRKRLVAASSIAEGQILTSENLTSRRVSRGISPMYYWDLLGKEAPKDYGLGESLKSDDFQLEEG